MVCDSHKRGRARNGSGPKPAVLSYSQPTHSLSEHCSVMADSQLTNALTCQHADTKITDSHTLMSYVSNACSWKQTQAVVSRSDIKCVNQLIHTLDIRSTDDRLRLLSTTSTARVWHILHQSVRVSDFCDGELACQKWARRLVDCDAGGRQHIWWQACESTWRWEDFIFGMFTIRWVSELTCCRVSRLLASETSFA